MSTATTSPRRCHALPYSCFAHTSRMPVNGGEAPTNLRNSALLQSFRLLVRNRQGHSQPPPSEHQDVIQGLENVLWSRTGSLLESAWPGALSGAPSHPDDYMSEEEGKDLEDFGQQSMDPEDPGHSSQGHTDSIDHCSWLHPGQTFSGFQRYSPANPARASSSSTQEDWSVTLKIHDCDWGKGLVCGIMEARNVPRTDSPIVTYWEGEVIDNTRHTFFTDKWGASHEIDMDHWSKFSPGFSARMRAHVLVSGGRFHELPHHSHVFMRLKEQAFVNVGPDCGLSITGFYYVCLDRQTGSLKGYYHDPHSTPYQYLELQPDAPHGHAFGSVAFA